MKRACRSVPCALLLGALAAWTAPRPARAGDVLEIPASCGSSAELEREVAALTPAHAGSWQRPSVRLRKHETDFVLEVELPDEQRTLRDPDCRSLFRAAVLISALGGQGDGALESATLLRERAAAPEPIASEGPKPIAAKIALTAPELPPQSLASPRFSGALSIGAALAYGAVPGVGVLVSAGLTGGRRRWALTLLSHYLAPGEARLTRAPRAGVRVDGLGASLSVEWRLTSFLRAGGGADLFLLRGTGIDVLRAYSDWSTHGTVHASATVGLYERGRFGVLIPLRFLYAPQPSRFVVAGRGTVYTAASFGFHAGVSLSWRFL